MKEVMMWNSPAGTVLSKVARSGTEDTFEAAVSALEKKLTSAEVMVEGYTSVVFLHTLYSVARWRPRFGRQNTNVVAMIPRAR